MDKMFAEPSNAILVRFLSMINEHFVKATDVVLERILSYVKGQKEYVTLTNLHSYPLVFH